jgi:hypothetical protein
MRVAAFLAVSLVAGTASAQYDDYYEEEDTGEPSLTVNGHLKLQTGVFVPLISDGFKPLKDRAWRSPAPSPEGQRCDPVEIPYAACVPESHGKKPGSMSMGMGTLQLEGNWEAHPDVVMHTIIRARRSMNLEADEMAQPPIVEPELALRREANMNWARENYYDELEFRELYIDAYPYNWLSLRLGRQQIAWGELGQYRLLDVINPTDTTWHFGPLESFEDTRIPLWMAKGIVDIPSIEHSVELVWSPLFFDRPEDTVNTPLTFVSAWGLPMSNTPRSLVREKIFMYPGGELKDMRGGARWKGNIGTAFTYSLVYYYTHQMTPPVNVYMDQNEIGETLQGQGSYIDKFYLDFPRQHIAGFAFDYAFESPIATVVKFEAAVEPERWYPTPTTNFKAPADLNSRESELADEFNRQFFPEYKKTGLTYGIQIFRPTMIRFLNPTQNILIVAQFMHSMILQGIDKDEEEYMVDVPGFNKMFSSEHSYTVVLALRTDYFHGLLRPSLLGAWLPKEGDLSNFFYTINLAFRFNETWNMALQITDFHGHDPYKSVGMFKDRDEVNLKVTCQF